jgi:hypothetical protein
MPKMSFGKPEGKTPKFRSEDDFKVDLTDIGCDSMDWFHMSRTDRWPVIVKTVMKFRVS